METEMEKLRRENDDHRKTIKQLAQENAMLLTQNEIVISKLTDVKKMIKKQVKKETENTEGHTQPAKITWAAQ